MNLQNQIELELYFADHFDTILFPVLADLYLNQNDLRRARKVCEIGLSHHENDPSGLYTLAKIEKVDGNLKEAEKALETVLLYSEDHLAAAKMLCEIQTVLGRASSRLLKSWKHVLKLDATDDTARQFITKVESNNKKEQKKKVIQPNKNVESKAVKKPKPKIETVIVPDPISEAPTEPLQVSSRLATFTLVAVLKNQGLFDQALDVLDALESKGEDKEIIDGERKSIQELVKNSL